MHFVPVDTEITLASSNSPLNVITIPANTFLLAYVSWPTINVANFSWTNLQWNGTDSITLCPTKASIPSKWSHTFQCRRPTTGAIPRNYCCRSPFRFVHSAFHWPPVVGSQPSALDCRKCCKAWPGRTWRLPSLPAASTVLFWSKWGIPRRSLANSSVSTHSTGLLWCSFTCSLEEHVLDGDAHLEAGKLSALRLQALKLDVIEQLVQQHYGSFVGDRLPCAHRIQIGYNSFGRNQIIIKILPNKVISRDWLHYLNGDAIDWFSWNVLKVLINMGRDSTPSLNRIIKSIRYS